MVTCIRNSKERGKNVIQTYHPTPSRVYSVSRNNNSRKKISQIKLRFLQKNILPWNQFVSQAPVTVGVIVKLSIPIYVSLKVLKSTTTMAY